MNRRLPIAILLAAALLGLAPAAQARYEPMGSGTTKLTLDRSFLALAERNGVKLSAVAPARLVGGTISFPVVGGKFDPTAAVGTVEHQGSLVFSAGGRSIPLKAMQVKTTQRRSPISAKVGGSQLKLGRARDVAVSRSGFGERIHVSGLSLSAKLATRLGKKLRLRGVFREGHPLGRAVTRAQPETIGLLARGKVSLTLDPGFAAKLDSLFVAVNPIFPAEHPGPFTLPILGGEIAPDGSQGPIDTSGSLEFLQQGGGQVFWAETRLDLAAATASPEVEVRPSPPYGGRLGPLVVADLALPGAMIASDSTARMVAVEGAAMALSAQAATVFNEVFAKPQGKTDVFATGEAFGSASFIAQGQ